MSASLSGVFSLQEFTDAGLLGVGYRLYTYITGTTTFKTAYTDAAGSVPQTYTSDGFGGQYIALNARGELPAPLYLAPGPYDICLKRLDGSTVWTRRADPIADSPSILFVGGLTSDDALALQTLANANPYKRILNLQGRTLNFYTSCIITVDGVTIDLNGGSIQQHTANIRTLVFQPTTAGSTMAFLNTAAVVNGAIDHSLIQASSTTDEGLVFVQCNGYKATNLTFYDAELNTYGGQFGRFNGCTHFANSGTPRGVGTALVNVRDAQVGALWQPSYVVNIDNWFAGGSKRRDAIFRFHSGDGLNLGIGYGNGGINQIVLIQASRAGSYVGPLVITEGAYFDCISSSGTINGVQIAADGFGVADGYTLANASKVYDVTIHATIGNGPGRGILCRKPETYALTLGGYIENMTSFGIDCETGIYGNVLIDSPQFSNCGIDGVSGDIRLSGGNSITLASPVHHGSKNVCTLITGAWGSGTAIGATNADGVAADISYSGATFATPMQFSGCSSRYIGAAANSWTGAALVLNSYANDAAAAAAGLQLGRLYHTAGVVHQRIV